MFLKEEFGSQRDLIVHIGQKLGRKFKYKTLNVGMMSGDESYQFICISKPNEPNIYLNLFICSDDSSYQIYIIKKIVGKYCLGELSEEEKKVVFSEQNNLFTYGKNTLCMEDVSDKSIDDILLYANKTDSFDNIYINLSVTERRKLVSDFIQSYIQFIEYVKTINLNSEEYNILSKMDIKTEIIDRIAYACMYARQAKKYLVKVNNTDGYINAKIHILKKDDSYETLFLSVDVSNLAIFYLSPVNGKWERNPLPNKIEDISKLFICGA